MRLLIVEDDKQLANEMEVGLERPYFDLDSTSKKKARFTAICSWYNLM